MVMGTKIFWQSPHTGLVMVVLLVLDVSILLPMMIFNKYKAHWDNFGIDAFSGQGYELKLANNSIILDNGFEFGMHNLLPFVLQPKMHERVGTKV